MEIKILLAEDDVNLGGVLSSYLSTKGYFITHCTNGNDAYEAFCKENYDICLFDIMMPLKDGFTLAKEIRKNNSKIPIIFISAKNTYEDIIQGLNIGADDYITKPFPMNLLIAKLETVLRRTLNIEEDSQGCRTVGKYTFYYTRQILEINGIENKLTSKEADLLNLLVEHQNEVLERAFTLKKLWGDNSYYNARSMDVYITKLRKYLKDDPNIDLINVHGIGFKLVIS